MAQARRSLQPIFGRLLSTQFWAIALVLLYFVVLSRDGFSAYFTHDDAMNMVALHACWGIPWWRNVLDVLSVFTSAYRPLGGLFYRFVYSIAGFNPVAFRIAYFAILLVNLRLFCWVARTISASDEVAVLGLLLFCYHGATIDLYHNTGTVYDLLCCTFILAALGAYVRNRRTGNMDLRGFLLVLALYCCALDAKEMAVSFPAIIVCYEFIAALPRFRLAGLSPVNPINRMLPVLGLGVVTAIFLAVKVPSLSSNPAYKPTVSIQSLVSGMCRYLDVLTFQPSLFTPFWLVFTCVLILSLGFIARNRALLFGFCFGMLALIPVAVIPGRAGFVLYLPLAGFAIAAASMLAALRKWLGRICFTTKVRFNGELAFLLLLAAPLFALNAHVRAQSLATIQPTEGRLRQLMRQMKGLHPTLPPGTRLLFVDNPIPENPYALMFLTVMAYNDPSLWVVCHQGGISAIDPNELAVFDAWLQYQDGKLQEFPIRRTLWTGIPVPVTFAPDRLRPGQSYSMSIGGRKNCGVDIEFRSTTPGLAITGVALGWTRLNDLGLARLEIPANQPAGTIEITKVRLCHDPWQLAKGRFAIVP